MRPLYTRRNRRLCKISLDLILFETVLGFSEASCDITCSQACGASQSQSERQSESKSESERESESEVLVQAPKDVLQCL